MKDEQKIVEIEDVERGEDFIQAGVGWISLFGRMPGTYLGWWGQRPGWCTGHAGLAFGREDT